MLNCDWPVLIDAENWSNLAHNLKALATFSHAAVGFVIRAVTWVAYDSVVCGRVFAVSYHMIYVGHVTTAWGRSAAAAAAIRPNQQRYSHKATSGKIPFPPLLLISAITPAGNRKWLSQPPPSPLRIYMNMRGGIEHSHRLAEMTSNSSFLPEVVPLYPSPYPHSHRRGEWNNLTVNRKWTLPPPLIPAPSTSPRYKKAKWNQQFISQKWPFSASLLGNWMYLLTLNQRAST